MAYQLSPGVLVKETDLTTVVPSVSTSAGGFAGEFAWGPADQVTYVGSENELAAVFGKPNANTYLSFFTAANFLAYSNQLLTIRAVGSAAKNAAANANTAVKITFFIIHIFNKMSIMHFNKLYSILSIYRSQNVVIYNWS